MKYPIAVIVCVSALLLPKVACAESPLADAIEKQHRKTFLELLGKPIDVNAAQVDGMTALHWAAHHDDLEAVRQLLKAGAKGAR